MGLQGGGGSIDLTGSLTEDRKWLYRLVAGYEKENSYRDHVDNEEKFVFPSLSWVPDAARRLDLQYEYNREDRASDDGLFVLNQDINQRADISTYYQEPGDSEYDVGHAVSLNYEHRFNDMLKTNVKWRSQWHEDERDLYENNSVQADDTLRRRNRQQYNKREYHFLDGNLEIDFDAGVEQKLLVGFNGGYEYRQYDRLAFDTRGANVSLINPTYTGSVLVDDPDSFRNWDLYNYGIYAQDQLFVTDKLTLLAGGRFDMQSGDYHSHSIDGDSATVNEDARIQTTAFNAGLVYEINNYTSVYTSYSESFNPQAIPTFDANGAQLDPEKGTQYEVGVRVSLLDDTLNMNMALFDLTKENVSETGDSGFDELVGAIESQGVEFSVQYQPVKNWQYQAGYAYTKAEVADTYDDDSLGNAPKAAPKHTASLVARYNHPRKILGGLVGVGMGWHYKSHIYTDEELANRVKLPGYHVTDLNLYYELGDTKLAFNVDNLFDETYFVGGTNDYKIYSGDPRKFTLTTTINF